MLTNLSHGQSIFFTFLIFSATLKSQLPLLYVLNNLINTMLLGRIATAWKADGDCDRHCDVINDVPFLLYLTLMTSNVRHASIHNVFSQSEVTTKHGVYIYIYIYIYIHIFIYSIIPYKLNHLMVVAVTYCYPYCFSIIQSKIQHTVLRNVWHRPIIKSHRYIEHYACYNKGNINSNYDVSCNSNTKQSIPVYSHTFSPW